MNPKPLRQLAGTWQALTWNHVTAYDGKNDLSYKLFANSDVGARNQHIVAWCFSNCRVAN